MKDAERGPAWQGAEGECKNSQAKGSDPDDTSESTLTRYTKGATESRCAADGNLSGQDGGRMAAGVNLSLFIFSASPPPLPRLLKTKI